MGKTLHQESTVRKGAVASLERRVHRILSNKVTEDNMLYNVSQSKLWTEVTREDIVRDLKTASKTLKLQDRGIEYDMVGAHSLRSGGAMAIQIMRYKYY